MIKEREMRLLGAFHWGCICGDGVVVVSRVVGTTDNDNNLEERKDFHTHDDNTHTNTYTFLSYIMEII